MLKSWLGANPAADRPVQDRTHGAGGQPQRSPDVYDERAKQSCSRRRRPEKKSND
jgi:putative addiction module component (TIGR02574 family)